MLQNLQIGLKFKKIVVDSVLDVCARETYELPSIAGFVLELKTPINFSSSTFNKSGL
ncbi:MAG: hypothetical protein P8J16_08365 [Polaribacter sp.]|jgi:hypothetical protein|nr:hypothetical protein [Polaribacter sp.]